MKYYIIAGEASGDLHGSNLIKALSIEDEKAEFRFWGGDMMLNAAAEGGRSFELVRHYAKGAVMGFTEVIKKGFSLIQNIKFCKKDIVSWKPDVVILIDYPGFNMQIASFCHSRGLKVFYYIVPKTWASRESRNKKLSKYVDKLFIVFPFEKKYFESKAMDFSYNGNPLVDAVEAYKFTRPIEGKYIAFLAGSRKAEIQRTMPVCMELADRLSALPYYKDFNFLVAGAPSRTQEDYMPYIGERKNIKLLFGATYDILKFAEAAVVNSGTASLEACLTDTPQVVCWSTSALTFFMAKYVLQVKKHIDYISLGNLCIGKEAFKELLQEDFNIDNLLPEVRNLVEDQSYRGRMLQDYALIRQSLGEKGASNRVAKAMMQELVK